VTASAWRRISGAACGLLLFLFIGCRLPSLLHNCHLHWWGRLCCCYYHELSFKFTSPSTDALTYNCHRPSDQQDSIVDNSSSSSSSSSSNGVLVIKNDDVVGALTTRSSGGDNSNTRIILRRLRLAISVLLDIDISIVPEFHAPQA